MVIRMPDYVGGAYADRLYKKSSDVKVYPHGRFCEMAGCDTRLSIYNRARTCFLHTPMGVFVNRGQRKSKVSV